MSYGPDPQLAGILDVFKKVEQTLRAPVNAVLKQIPGGSTVIAAANAVKGQLSTAKASGAGVQNITPAAVTAGLQTAADAARADALAQQAREAALLGAGFRVSPMMLAALGLGAYLLLSPRRRSNPRRRRRTRRAR